MAQDAKRGPGFLDGGGETGALIRAHDWSSHPLGHPSFWPRSLKTAMRLMLNTRHPAYIFWGEAGHCFYNDTYRPSIGAERHPGSLGRPARDVWSEIWPVIGPQIEQVMAGRGATWHEHQLIPITRDGRLEDVYWTYGYSPIDDEDSPGGVGGVLVLCNETTGEVLAEQRLIEERTRQQQMLLQMPGFVAILTGPTHIYTYVNQAYIEISGPRRFIGRGVREVFPEIADQGFYELLDRVFATGESYAAHALPISLDREDGDRVVDLLYQPIRDSIGQVTGIFVGGYDVTERVRAVRDLAESEERLRLATEHAEIGLWDVDPINDILIWPARTKAMFGISPQVPVTMVDFYQGLHPDDLAKTSEAYAAAADPARRELYEIDYRTIGKEDGRLRWIAAKGRGVFDEQGRCIRVAGTAVEITARREAEARLRELNETLEARVAERTAALEAAHEQLRQSQKLEAMGSLTGGVAHDFNNLLTPIVGALEMLQRRGVGGEREQRLIAGAAQSADRAKLLVQRLLAFARRQPLQSTAVDVGALVTGMADLLRSTTGPQIRLVVDIADGLPAAAADANQLEMALLNLGVNARDAMVDGGTLRITADLEEIAGSHRAALRPGRYVHLSVADTGIGMSAETAARAVEPFFSTKGIGKGTGLGLSMVHGLASQLGGALVIQSHVGIGTNIELWLPASDALADPREAAAAPAATMRTGTVLLVDDEELVRLSTADLLADLGYDVVEADSAEVALHLIADGLEPDLVVTDHLMPGMSGTDLFHRVRAARPSTPILIVSGYAEAGGIAPDLPRLTKPFRRADLVEALDNLTG